MAKIRPFIGYRPRPDLVEKVASRPYDVMSREEAREDAEENPYSFLRVIRSEIEFDPELSAYDEQVYAAARDNFWSFLEQNVFLKDHKACFYLYRLIMGDVNQVGLVCGSSIDDYQNGVIKKHEFTRPVKEEDRIKHISTTGIHAGPVFCAYRKNESMDALSSRLMEAEPAVDFSSEDGVQHSLWVIDGDEDIKQIVKLFENEISETYIADGHHRAASTSKVGFQEREQHSKVEGDEPFNYFLTVLFPHDQVNCIDYNRVVKDLNGHSKQEFLDLVAEKFEINSEGQQSFKPTKARIFGMYISGEWYSLSAKREYHNLEDAVGSLDISILHDQLLYPILGIKDQRTDDRIDFIGGIRGMKELESRVDSGEMQIAFSIFPVSLDQLFSVADSGEVMPPKSTWFEPKLRSGMVVHAFRENVKIER